MLQDMTTDRFRKILLRLAIFCIIVLINQKLLFQLFFFPAKLWYAYYGVQASYDAVYFISWLASDISSYLVPALAAFFLFRKDNTPLQRREDFKAWAELPLVFFASCFAGSIASIITEKISELLDKLFGTGEIPDAMAGSLPDEGQSGSAWIFILFVVIIAPICEELIFRKLLLQPLRGCGDMFAAVAAAFIFGVFHGNFDQFPYAFAVGMLYGVLAVRSSSILPTLTLHFANNLLVTASLYLTDMFGEDAVWAAQLEEWAGGFMSLAFWLGIPALVLMAVFRMFSLRREGDMPAGELLREPTVYIAAVGAALMLL